MTIARYLGWGALTCAAALCVSDVSGQTGRGARVSRPTRRTSSELIGRVGGIYTRNQIGSTLGKAAPGEPQRPISDIGGFGFGIGPAADQQFLLPAIARPSQSYFVNQPINAPYRVIRSGRPRIGQLLAASRLDRANALNTPIEGWKHLGPEHFHITIPEYGQATEQDGFQEFFGLHPPQVPSAAPQHEVESLGLALERETDRYVERMIERGKKAFRAGTGADSEDRNNQLTRAMQMLGVVRSSNDNVEVPLLLIAHAALEKGQVMLAAQTILHAVERNPRLLSQKPDIAGYFGDPTRLDLQARHYARAGELASATPHERVLSAYCAWILDDPQRARQVLAAAERETQGEALQADIRVMSRALEAAQR